MSVPFIAEVAAGAVAVLTNPARPPANPGAALDALQVRFPGQHPLLLSEHLDYAALLVRAGAEMAARVRAGAVARADALLALQRGFPSFSEASIAQALGRGLGDPDR